jgi:hypothetical protein
VPELILVNANVITMDPVLPKAQLVAIRDGKIVLVSGNPRLRELRKKETRVIDCKGKTVLPGFIDTHFHLHGFAESLITLNLEPRHKANSISDIQDKIEEAARKVPSGTWIRGRGYNEFYLTEKRHPTRWDLDKATSTHPIKLTHRSGRAHVLNSLALQCAAISRETGDPPGGLIDRDVATGEPTGLLYGMGHYLGRVIPPIDPDQMEHGIRLADRELGAFGITSLHDASPRNNLKRWKMFQHWQECRLLKSRVCMMLGIEGFDEYAGHAFASLGGDQLQLGGVKIILHETTGELTPCQEALDDIVFRIHQSGRQVVLHAIEGNTIGAACSAIGHALSKLPRPDHRHRVEHCSVCTPSMARRLASLGIVVVTQPSFIYYHGERYLRTVPDANLKHLYPIATLMKNGVKVVGSSDCPIVPANPLIGIYAAVSRRTEKGELVLPEEGVTPLEAIQMYTSGAAKSNFEEGIKGSITPGKLADMVVLNGDPTELSTLEIKDIEVEMTLVNGEVVWDKSSGRRENCLSLR